jgi:hypothetical protein
MNVKKSTWLWVWGLAAVLYAGEKTTFYTPQRDQDGLERNNNIRSDLPNVLILGDSISIGYTKPAAALLKDTANVQRPPENCGNTARGLKQIDVWLGGTQWDVIHFNWGLHDLCYRSRDENGKVQLDKINGVQDVPLEQYEKNLEQLVQRLEKTGAVLIWASTTPVPDGEAGRVVRDELKYNAVAENVMKRHGIAVNDLHTTAVRFNSSLWAGPGNVHFRPEGSEKLAVQVAEVIRDALKVKKQ